MSGFQKTMFTLAMAVLVTQTFRHVYVKWFEDRTSVLDQFTKNETDKEIDKAQSLAELVAKYRPLEAKVKQLNAQSKGMSEADRTSFHDKHADEYRQEGQVAAAIRDWESKTKEIRELRIFWMGGLILVLVGAAVYAAAGRWLGMALVVPGFVEMTWWTSPSFSLGGARLEFDRLLNNKIFFSAATLLLVLLAWLALGWLEKKRGTGPSSSATAEER